MNTVQQLSWLPKTDDNGLILDPTQWNEHVARTMATQLGIGELGQEHWQVIETLRDYYRKFGVAPAMNHICHRYGQDKLWVHNLFGTCLNAWCIAGLPDPGEEAKSYLNDM
ncbi:MAG: TusE/DsrC/DsvC family sulfur relay protein [Thioalkalispiraceae bacterium]|jgi:tRNA 2-thiouridine synthesizing protein E